MTKKTLFGSKELSIYLKEIKKIPIITNKRENEIFDLLEITTDIDERNELINEIVKGNIRFVVKIATQYQNYGIDIMDLISEGNIGLHKAVLKYNREMNVKFISCAVFWIKQAILSCLYENARTIRLPLNIIQEIQKNKKENPDYNDLNHGVPSCIDLFSENPDSGVVLYDTIPNVNDEFDIFNDPTDVNQRLNQILSVLTDREKLVIEKFFGLNCSEHNLDDLSEILDCTKERVRQIKDVSLQKLRNHSHKLLKVMNI